MEGSKNKQKNKPYKTRTCSCSERIINNFLNP